MTFQIDDKSITLPPTAPGDIPTPATGEVTQFFGLDGRLYAKDSTGAVYLASGGGGGGGGDVATVNGVAPDGSGNVTIGTTQIQYAPGVTATQAITTAQATAETANTNALNAQTDATAAFNSAATANTTANAANDKANTALEVADNAMPIASLTPAFTRDQLQSLTASARLDVSAVKGSSIITPAAEKPLISLDGVSFALNTAGSQPNTYSVIGDSMTAGAIIRSVTSTTNQLSYATDSFLYWASGLSHQRLSLLNHYGVGGKTIAEVISEQLPNALADKSGHIVALFGINTINAGATLDQLKAGIETVLTAIQRSGKIIWWGTILPLASGFTDPTGNRKKQVRQFNAYLRDAESRYSCLRVIDTYGAIVNPATGFPQTAYIRADGLHPTVTGAMVMGKLFADEWTRLLVPAIRPVTSVLDSYVDALSPQLLTNVLFTASSGGLATDWVKANNVATSTETIVARTTGGNFQRQVITAAANGEFSRLRQTGLASRFAGYGGKVAFGQVYVEIDEGATNFAGIMANFEIGIGSVTTINSNGNGTVANEGIIVPAGGLKLTVRTPYVTLPELPYASSLFDFRAIFAGAGGATMSSIEPSLNVML